MDNCFSKQYFSAWNGLAKDIAEANRQHIRLNLLKIYLKLISSILKKILNFV